MLTIARVGFTIFCMVAFAYVVWFAFNRRSQTTHEAVGRSIIDDDDNRVTEIPTEMPTGESNL